MKKRLLSRLMLAVLILAFALTGCSYGTNNSGNDDGGGGDTNTRTYYTVTFDSMGGSETTSQSVLAGNPVVRPNTPTREGYFLIGWFRDSAANDEWHFNTDRVNADITLYAGWQQVSSPDEEAQPTASLVFELEDDTYTVTGVGEETVVVIPSTYEGLPVTKIQGTNRGAFARKKITEITIPDSITEIGQNTFNNCSDLVTVNIGENSGLTTIGNNAFSGNSSLTSIYLPSGVTSIGDSAFNNCGALERITVAETNTVFSSEGNALIERATSTLIRGTNNTVIPDGITIIAQAAFRRSTITQINIPASVTEIGNYAFDDCENLASINVADGNTAFASQDGVLYNKAMTELIETPEGITGEISLPSTLTEIPRYAFDGRNGLTSVFIPSGALNNIAYGAFRNTSLTVRYEGTEDEWNAITKHSSWGGAALTVLFGATINPDETPDESAEGILVVYFSCTERTQGVAEYIAAASSGKLVEIIPEVAYTAADLNYSNSSSRSQVEGREDARPAISNATYESIDMSKYATVFIGYPIWNGYEPMIIRSFIEHYEGLSGKTVYTFSTSATSGGGTAHGSVSRRCQNATVGGNLHLTNSALANAAASVNSWIEELGLSAS